MQPARLEGFHAVKHALRFRARVHRIVTGDAQLIRALAADLAPDLAERLQDGLETLTPEEFRALTPRPLPSPILAWADPRPGDSTAMLSVGDSRPLVLLENPRHAGNLGAAVRVAAAAGAAGVLSSGDLDPWSTAALRGSAGLHYAVDVAAVQLPLRTQRQVIALDPDGERLTADDLQGGPLLVFGTERAGLSEGMLQRADRRLALPMAPGVSSLNLATAVSATLFAWRLAQPEQSPLSSGPPIH